MAEHKWREAFELVSQDEDPIGEISDYALLAKSLSKQDRHEQVLRVVEIAQGQSAELSPEIDLALALHKAKGLAGIGKRKQALDIYRRLVDQETARSEHYEAYANLLTRGDSQEELQKALAVWQEYEKRSKPGGPRWLRARQARLELLRQLGKGEQAEKLLQLTKLLYPRTVGVLETIKSSESP